MLGQIGAVVFLSLCSLAVFALAEEQPDVYDTFSYAQRPGGYYDYIAQLPEKRESMPGVLRFGKRAQSFIRFGRSDEGVEMQKKQMPGVLRFGKRDNNMQEKKSVPGVLRFGKRNEIPEVLRFDKRSDIPGVLRFGKKSVPGVLRFGRK